uniref:Gustatory receptor n=2 Tax=Parascaris univalens TaxID=6257 RepID=A0A915ARG4_PARUN
CECTSVNMDSESPCFMHSTSPFSECHMRPSVSSPNSLNSGYAQGCKPAFIHVHPSPSVILSGDEFANDELTCRTNVNEPLSASLSKISSPQLRIRTYSANCSMPAYGPDGRTLVKGATITTTSPRPSTYSVRLDRRYGHSCDFTERPRSGLEDPRTWENPIAQVSSDILRLSGYSNQFRTLLTGKSVPRRESGPGALLQDFSDSKDEKCNGGVRFDSSADTEVKHKSSSAVRVIRRRQSGYGIAISSDSTAKMRCRMRKQLFIKRNRVCDLSLALALAGLIFVVVDAELTALSSDTNITKRHPISLLLRSLCVISTLALMASLVNYHAIEVKIALIDSGADDWRVALTTERLIKLAIELLICSICPLPGTGMMSWPFIHPENRKVTMVDVPVDVILSVPMFLRSYLLCRFMVLHSKQFQDAATRSIAALNRISMDFRFVIKTMMADHPLRVLIVFTVSYWVCMSWMFTQCERYDGRVPAEHYYLNSMWFIMVMAILYQILIVVEHFQ